MNLLSPIYTLAMLKKVLAILLVTIITSFIIGADRIAHAQQQQVSNANTTKNVTSNNSKFSVYQNGVFGIRISYPSDWVYFAGNNSISEVDKIPTLVIFQPTKPSTHSGMYKPELGFSIGVLYNPLSLSTYINSTVNNQEARNPTFQLRESKPIMLPGNVSAYKIIFESHGQKSLATFLIKNNILYLMRYFAPIEKYSLYIPSVEKMIASLQLMNPKNLTEHFLTYQNSTYGIKIQYPIDWLEQLPENASSPIIRSLQSPAGNILSIWRPIFSPNMTLVEYTNLIILIQANVQKKHYVNSTVTSVAGNPAYQSEFTSDIILNDGRTIGIKEMYITTKKGNEVYEMRYTATQEKFAVDLPVVQKMIGSFVITK
jgi:hypothetical protein